MPNIIDKAKFGILRPFVGTEVIEPTAKSRTIDAVKNLAIGVGAGLAFRALMRKTIPVNLQKKMVYKSIRGPKPKFDPKIIKDTVRLKGSTPMTIASDAAFGTIFGLYERDIKNAIVKANADPKKKDEALKLISDTSRFAREAGSMEKAAFFRGIAKATMGAGRAVGGGLFAGLGKGGNTAARKLFGTGDNPLKFSHHVFGAAVKGGAAYGAFKGGKAGFSAYKRLTHETPRTYNTLLRNNMLAGKISPQEMSPSDYQSVRKLGMR